MSKKIIKPLSFNNSKGLPAPTEELDKQQGFIKWGKKNDYPFYLIEMYGGSAWHQGIVKKKSYYIAGGGVEVVNGEFNNFLENKWTDFTIDEVMKKCAFDFELFDAFAVIGTWNKEGSRVVMWEHVDIDKIRKNADETIYFISDDWTARKQSEEKTGFRAVTPLDKNNKSGKFIIYYQSPTKQTKEDKGVYPKPNYYGGLTAINTDVLISQYHLYEIQNGFKGGTIVNLANGQPEDDEEARKHRDAIKDSSTGVEHSNELIITFSDGQENAPTVVSLQGNDLADRYNMTEKSVQQNVLVAHGATNPVMFGIIQEGSFNAAESKELFQIFVTTYVETRQESLEWLLNLMGRLSGATGKMKLVTPSPFKTEETVEPSSEMSQEFRSADKDLKVFSEYGDKKDKYKVVRKFSVPNEFNASDVAKMEDGNFSMFFDAIGDIRANLTQLDKNILTLLKDGEDSGAISKAVDKPLVDVVKSINKLEKSNLLVDGSTSTLGNQVLEGLDIEIDQFEVRYSYEVKAGLGQEVIPTSRDFCKELIRQDRFYSRDEINTISTRIERDVWRYRGGFYHNPTTGRTSPWCRHEWVQHLVVKK